MSLSVRTRTGVLIAEGGYSVTKEGLLKWRVNAVRGKGMIPGMLKQGEMYSLKCEVKDGTLTLSDLKTKSGKEAPEAFKTLLQGDYQKLQPGGFRGKKQ
jgi:hypothetical protein